jgi:tetratricopeptide (TPR) repeat protein
MITPKIKKVYLLYLSTIITSLVLLSACAPAIKDTILDEYSQRAITLEQSGDTTSAIEELKIALTIDPDNSHAKAQLQRLSEKRDQEAQRHYQWGLSLKEKDPQGARRAFLTALRIKPDYMSALDELKKQHLELTVSKLETRMTASRENGENEKETKEDDYGYLGIAISFYENGNYQAAINELLKAKSKYPRSSEVSKYLNMSYYNMGKMYYDNKDDMNALHMLTKVKKGSESAEPYLTRAKVMVKALMDKFYKEGLQFYRQQKLQEAIEKWSAVLEIDPHHRKAQEYIQKSKKLLEALKK